MENKNKGTKRPVESIEQCVTPTAESQGLQQSGMESKNKETKREVERIEKYVNLVIPVPCSVSSTDPFDAIWQSRLEEVMVGLADPNVHLIRVHGSHEDVIERVRRRVDRDKLFDTVLTVVVTKKPNVKKIQGEIARQLGLDLNNKSKDKRARELIERLKIEQKILIILRRNLLHKEPDLDKVGIPYGSDHTGCKILLSSELFDTP